ncbi:MAG: methylmalonyl-CoA mutase family protein, partial [Gammaproteobacteria bacterium]
KDKTDSGERVVVGVNKYRTSSMDAGVGERFSLNAEMRDSVISKYNAIRDNRDENLVQNSLKQLSAAALNDKENLMPYLVECCHAYATVGEMITTLKTHWGEFQEPSLQA